MDMNLIAQIQMFKKHISLFLLHQYTSDLESLLGSILVILGVLASLWICKSSMSLTIIKSLERSFQSLVIRLPSSLLKCPLPYVTCRPQICGSAVLGSLLGLEPPVSGFHILGIPHFWTSPLQGTALSLLKSLSPLGHPDFPSLQGLRKSPFLLLPLQGPPFSLLLPGHLV